MTDECVFHHGNTIFAFHIDDGILVGPNSDEIDQAIKDSQEAMCHIEDKGSTQDCLGVSVKHLPGRKIKLTQPHLIDQIVHDIGLTRKTKITLTPAKSTITHSNKVNTASRLITPSTANQQLAN